uniref:Aa_trans domain-containing protein n=1 Tax=Heterorhabditis bacteriophora TaxID=37862 RepID=A0A1I7WV00_HETBA
MECCSIGYVPMETTDPILKIVPMRMRSATVLVGGLICMLSYGSVYTFGNLLPYMVSFIRWKVNPQMTAGSMIWLQTLMNFVYFSNTNTNIIYIYIYIKYNP